MNNSKLLVFLSCLFAAILAAPILTAAPRGGGGGRPGFSGGRPGFSGGRPGFNGGHFAGRGAMGNFRGNNFHGNNRHGNNWHWHGHPNHIRNNVVFIGGFGFPWWWGWGWGGGPWWGWDPYPYGYYGYGYPYGYGYGYGYGNGYGQNGYGYNQNGYGYNQNGYGQNQNGYGQYGEASQSRVAELQRRLQRAGYYRGSVDGVLGPQTRNAIRAYERDHGRWSQGEWERTAGRLFQRVGQKEWMLAVSALAIANFFPLRILKLQCHFARICRSNPVIQK